MIAWGVDHSALNVRRGQAVEVRILIQGCEFLEESLEVLVRVFNILQHAVT